MIRYYAVKRLSPTNGDPDILPGEPVDVARLGMTPDSIQLLIDMGAMRAEEVIEQPGELAEEE